MSDKSVSLHRFGDSAALAVLGTDGTVYLTLKEARKLRRDMGRLIRSIERESFGASTLGRLGADATGPFGGSLDRDESGHVTGR